MAEQETQNEQQSDKSMEEVLHSIRDIIAGDEAEDAAGAAESAASETDVAEQTEDAAADASASEENDEPDDVLELTDVVEKSVESENTDQAEGNDVLDEIDAALNEGADAAEESAMVEETETASPEMEAEPAIEEVAPAPSTPEPEVQPSAVETTQKSEALLSEGAAQASSSAFKELVNTIPRPHIDSPGLRDGSTVEDLVVEALRPMLAEWLDKNLPTVVEQLVEKEIRKIVPKD